MPDRPYQIEMHHGIYASWNAGHRNVCGVLPTGGGKTHIFSGVLKQEMELGPVCAIAHRKELVGQMSLALARRGVRHNVIGPTELVKFTVQNQIDELGTSFYNPSSPCTVVAVKTLLSRRDQYAGWAANIRTWVLDEGHHLLRDNEWGQAIKLFSNARGLAVTATPCRADGKGLGRHADGLIDSLVIGPSMRDLITMGYLCDYRIFCPGSDLKMMEDKVGSTGDWSPQQLKAAAKKSHIVGDVVEQYLKLARGQRTIVFSTDVETAGETARNFQANGVRAEVVTGTTQPAIRNAIIRQFRNGQIDVLVNVDLFGEGFDVPAVECVMFARPTESYGLYMQMFGRALRILDGKQFGTIIDMVGNVARHNLPDIERLWSLNSREKTPRARSLSDTVAQTTCTNCTQPFPAFHIACPYCGADVVVGGRSSLEQVKGDLHELSPELLAKMRAAHMKAMSTVAQLERDMRFAGVPERVIGGALKSKQKRLDSAHALQAVMSWWAQLQFQQGLNEREVNKKFYLLFGTDPLTAPTQSADECLTLAKRIIVALGGPTMEAA